MYLDYWKLNRQPFNNTPDPAMYFSMHQSVETSVGEILFAVEEGDECLAVVTGPVGVGKTTTFRIVLDSLDEEKYNIAYVTNPDLSFTQLMREIVGQLENKECELNRKEKLLERFNQILFETADAGKRVLVFIDEGNVIKPANLDSLRLLTNMQDDEQNLFTIILAGQPELSRRLEDPRRENLFQRIGVYCKLEGLDCIDTMRDYIEHRMERAGHQGPSVWTEEALEYLWEASGEGVPRLVNKLCKLALKAGETNELNVITADVVEAVASRFVKKKDKPKRTRKAAPKAQASQAKPAAAPEPVTEVKSEPVEVVKKEEALEITPWSTPETAGEPVAEPTAEEAPQTVVEAAELVVEETTETTGEVVAQRTGELDIVEYKEESAASKEELLLTDDDLDDEASIDDTVAMAEADTQEVPVHQSLVSNMPSNTNLMAATPQEKENPLATKANRLTDLQNELSIPKDVQRKASRMAIERLKLNPSTTQDPYQAWLNARNEIIDEMCKANNKSLS